MSFEGLKLFYIESIWSPSLDANTSRQYTFNRSKTKL